MSWKLDPIACPLCGEDRPTVLGTRGNREYFGADPAASPHISTKVVQCLACDFIYTNPMIRGMEHLESAYYSDPARYQATAEGDPAKMFRSRLDILARTGAGGDLLDVGAGKGEFLAEARARGWRAVGIEPSEKFCAHARERHGVEVEAGFLGESEVFGGRRFDAITFNHVIEHVDSPVGLLRRAAGLLKPDGVVFVEVPNCGSHLLRLADAYFRLKGLGWSSRLSPLHPPFHRYGYTALSLGFLLEKAGFELVSMQTLSGSDRGYRNSGQSWETTLREWASRLLDAAGNRELLATVARPRRGVRHLA